MFIVDNSFLFLFFLTIWISEGQELPSNLVLKDLKRVVNHAIICKLQPDKFDCLKKGYSSYGFYYDIKMEDCKSTPFGTCSDNYNRFSVLSDCQDTCREAGLETITANITEEIFCRLQPDFGQCHDYHPMWYYDVSHRECRGFSYSGCGGNLNRFATVQLCTAHCAAVLAL